MTDAAKAILKRLEFLVGGRGRMPKGAYGHFEKVVAEVGSLDDASLEDLNKLLVAGGFNRVSSDFFDFFSGLVTEVDQDVSLFDKRLTEWRKQVIVRFANVRFAFRKLRRVDRDVLELELRADSIDLSSRKPARHSLQPIVPEDTPLLGHIAGGKVRQIRRAGVSSRADAEYLERFERAREKGVHNLYEYCTSEHLDVYVATSMRDPEDFYAVGRFVGEVFDPAVAGDLQRLSYFDPTQASHDDRIVKGIVEGLMLKRSFCTVYLAQEKDTFGKDSELATTLVQGKPAIVYVPRIDDIDREAIQITRDLQLAADDDPITWGAGNPPEYNRLEDRLRTLFPFRWARLEPGLSAPRIQRRKVNERYPAIRNKKNFRVALEAYVVELQRLFEKRAKALAETHPLGVQVVLHSGVPNGILVVRSAPECRELIREMISGGLAFDILARTPEGEVEDLEAPLEADRVLRERRTGSIYRAAIGESPEANAFWNFYSD